MCSRALQCVSSFSAGEFGVHTHVCVFTRPLLCMYTHVYVYTRFGGLRGKRDFAGGRWLGMHVRVCACVQIVGCT